MTGPGIRNSWTKAAVRRSRSFPPAAKARFTQQAPEPILESVRSLGNTDWIALDDALVVLDALLTALDDDDAYVEFWRELIYDSYAGGLFSQLIKRASTITGDGKRLLKLAPQAWAISTTHCGVVDVVSIDGSLRLESKGFPQPVLESRAFALLFKGALLGMLGFVGGKGEVSFERREGPDGSVESIGFKIGP